MRIARRCRDFLLGRPLATHALKNERLSNTQGLAIFASDALSSTAYATEEILLVLAAVSLAATSLSIPIALIISGLIILVMISYQQVVHAYPQGGGVYNVAKENLGELPSLVGAASLLIDYVLTAAVSVAAGVAAITSAVPSLFAHRVSIGIGFILLLMWANLRGVRESGKMFSVPTYLFMGSFFLMIGYGIWLRMTGDYPAASIHLPETHQASSAALGLLIIFRAFASGCTAMTGIEATSNGVQAFRPPEAANAAKTLLRMACMLVALFIGITLLAHWGGIVPRHNETVVSQVARLLFDRGPLYFVIQGATVLILVLAANTPFAGFPRVASQLAKDEYFPHQFLNLGSRLVFANGIIVLAACAAFLIYLFGGNVHALIPLYAVGVFLGFSLSQLGMIKHWFGLRSGGVTKLKGIMVNSIGLVATVAVFGIVLFSKFAEGAWILVPAIVLIVVAMKKINSHYSRVKRMLALDGSYILPVQPDKTMVILVHQLNSALLHTVEFVKSFRPAHIRCVHVAVDPQEAGDLRAKWEQHKQHFTDQNIQLDILVSEDRDLIGPVLDHLKKLARLWDNDELIVVITEIIPERIWQHFLHSQTALRLRFAIEEDPDIPATILDVPVKVSTRL